jgi:hypothetical protein
MRTAPTLILVPMLASVVACGITSEGLIGDWQVARHDFIVQDANTVDGTNDVTFEGFVENIGTMSFANEASPTGIGEGTMRRTLSEVPDRTLVADPDGFVENNAPGEVVVGFDHAGFNAEPEQFIVYDADDLYNGAWIIKELGGTAVIEKSFFTDFGGGPTRTETSRFTLRR